MNQTIYRLAVLIFLISFLGYCQQADREVTTTDEDYSQAVADFYMSLGASQTDQSRFAFNKMNDVAQVFPEETAAWANLAVFAMRQGNFELADERMHRALEISPDHEDVLFLASVIESRRGNVDRAIELLRRAKDVVPENLRVHYTLVRELERQDDTVNAPEIRRNLEQLHEMDPQNQVVLLELVRFGVKVQDTRFAENYLGILGEQTTGWDAETREQFNLVTELLGEGNFTDLSLELSFLRSRLESLPQFRDHLLRVQLPPTEIGYLITSFINLPQPDVRVAAPDLDLQLEHHPLDMPSETANWVKGVTLLEDSPPFPISISNGEVIIDENTRIEFPGNGDGLLPPHVLSEIDYNYNFRNDIALAGSEGFRLYRLDENQTFSDVTSEIGIPAHVVNGNYHGVWAFDIEMDGDLDLLLATQIGPPIVLRNNGDDTFTEINPFENLENVRKFLWADLDGDGAPEATFLTENGSVFTFINERGGHFDSGRLLADNAAAIAVADLDADGQFDIITADIQGVFRRHYYKLGNNEWQAETAIEGENLSLQRGESNLFVADFDNNGALDLILSDLSRTIIWLADEDHELVRIDRELPGGIVNVFDVDGNERLDLLGIAGDFTPFMLKNEGTKNYFARSIRARASGELGDQRINSFGIGGEMEVRSGLLYQKQLISSPLVHFGLGEYDEAQMLRIIWPNGSVQAEFAELGMGATIFNEQILKGSCPWLFSNDGEDIHFITDALWRSPLGLRINAQETAGVIQTYDRVKIPGYRLNPVEGMYDLRITAELWETHFFDYVSLVAVDHPADTEIFVDERFVFPAPDLSTRLMTSPQPVSRVTDEYGNDLTDKVSQIDEQYIKPFTKTAYQGLVNDHSIVIELNDSSADRGDWLILSGWLRPTDSSINLALSQGSIEPPRGLKVEVNGPDGEWITLHEDYGIPAGKLKTILIDLEDAFGHSENRKVKLSTTSEIYWDGIFQAEKTDQTLITETRLNPVLKELRYRGFSVWNRADDVSPKLPIYGEISSTAQRWRDLEGFHTRFGDVSDLLSEIDDRYVIMNAGDELVLHFEALNEPKEGYTRSYIFESDGWVKDGDYNTEASATVLPLPYHGQADYEYQSTGSLFTDPVFRRHSEDWVNYHTRYVTPHEFRSALLLNNGE